MSRIDISDRARADLRGIWGEIAVVSVRRADRMIDRMIVTLDLLAGQPLLGTRCEEVLTTGRFMVVKPYVIYYRPHEWGVEVVRVLHGARDAETHLQP